MGCSSRTSQPWLEGLYKQGDIRRDKGFTIFYIGINLGAFISSLVVGYVGEVYGWHYGFGLAGIGMGLGLLQYVLGLKYLSEVGNFLGDSKDNKEVMKAPLTKIEIDRVVVLLISFLLVIVFWGAFEQAGGLMNIYTMEKTDRLIGDWHSAGFMVPVHQCHVHHILRNNGCFVLGQQEA